MKKITLLMLLLVVSIVTSSCFPRSFGMMAPTEVPETFSTAAEDAETISSDIFLPEAPEEYVLPDVIRDYHADDRFVTDKITSNHTEYFVTEASQNRYFNGVLGRDNNDFNLGFYVLDLETGASFGYNARGRFAPACTIKAGYALFVCRQIAKGEGSFEETMVYEGKHYVKGTSTIRKLGLGAELTVYQLIEHMLYESDNIAYYMLIDRFGYDGYNELMEQLGVINRIGVGNRWSPLSPLDLGLIWKEIYNFRDECPEGRFLWEQLTTNRLNDIAAALKNQGGIEYDVIAHKSGWSEDAYGDAGIVMSDHPYIIVVMTDAKALTKPYPFFTTVVWLDKLMKNYHAWYDEQTAEETTAEEMTEAITDSSN